MVRRDIELLKDFPKARYHVLHISSKKTVELIKEAKSKNLPVSCEVSPHHLFFSSEDIIENNFSFKMNPPLRSKKDKEALLKGLNEGVIDFVATDHAPHEKKMKSSSFVRCAFGTTGLETSLRVLLHFRNQGLLSTKRLVEVFSYNGARFLDLPMEWGFIEKGKEFYGSWIDPDYKYQVVSESDLASKSKNSCFIGSKLPGKVLGIILKNKEFWFN